MVCEHTSECVIANQSLAGGCVEVPEYNVHPGKKMAHGNSSKGDGSSKCICDEVLSWELQLINWAHGIDENASEFLVGLKGLFKYAKTCTSGEAKLEVYECITYLVVMQEQPFVIPQCTKIAQIRDIGKRHGIPALAEFAEHLMCHLFQHLETFWGDKADSSSIMSEDQLFDRFFMTCLRPSCEGLLSISSIYGAFVNFVGWESYSKAEFHAKAKLAERGFECVRRQKRMGNKRVDERWYKAEFIESAKPFLYARLNGAPHDHPSVVEMVDKASMHAGDE